jgi:hypothetical protein
MPFDGIASPLDDGPEGSLEEALKTACSLEKL